MPMSLINVLKNKTIILDQKSETVKISDTERKMIKVGWGWGWKMEVEEGIERINDDRKYQIKKKYIFLKKAEQKYKWKMQKKIKCGCNIYITQEEFK